MKTFHLMIGVTSALLLSQVVALSATTGTTPGRELPTPSKARATEHRPVLLISIDGLSAESLRPSSAAELNIPVLRGLMREGSYAHRVINVNPTVTSPNHTTLVTGVSPAIHGVFNNRPFAPTVKLPPSYSQYETIRVPTLWSVAKDAGLRTASLYWPVTQGKAPIDNNVVTGDSHDDEQITKDAIRILAEDRPHLLTVHYVSHDSAQHAHGPGSAEGRASLEKIDKEIGKLITSFREQYPRGVVAVASDHGFDRTTREVNLNMAFADAGYIRFTDATRSEVKSWRAFAWYVGGSAMVVLQNPDDVALEKEMTAFLNALSRRPEAGIAAIVRPTDLHHSGMSDQAHFVIALKPGYRMGNAMKGTFSQSYSGGSHGAFSSATERQDMHSVFILTGDGIAADQSLGTIDVRQIAPTLARLLDVPLPQGQLEALASGK